MTEPPVDDASSGEPEIALAGGSMTTVVRVGDTVRRPVGRWTPAVHSLLRHLEDVGFEGAPRVLGIDDRGREVLTYLPSEPAPHWSEEALIGAAQLVRRMQDALADFVPAPDAVWRCPSIGRRAAEGRIGHNDLQPANTVYLDGVPYGFIDWDLAGPSRPLNDVAQAAITFTPLHHGEKFRPPGCPDASERIARLRVFADAYGAEDRLALLDAVEELQREELQEMREYGEQGISPYCKFLAGNEHRYLTWDYEWLLANRRVAIHTGATGVVDRPWCRKVECCWSSLALSRGLRRVAVHGRRATSPNAVRRVVRPRRPRRRTGTTRWRH